ncbi:hypothetical protein SEUCBS140593_001668 [Sporothrix eucalyptigena]|uniref:tetrahydrofolate synthase n=1 Tax=Sporothrix eucalyptigena TaxID=1812306 RepID=A0ABP0B0C2_9PEZI
MDITERIRIDFAPLSHDAFAKYVFKIRDGLRLRLQPNRSRPRYLQLLALVSFHAFLQEKVDVAIYETHSGGEYCATNVIQQPIVTGLTRIGMDHVHSLGPTIENIAWHKAGIFKTGSPALSQIQEHAVARVLQQRALAKGIDLQFIDMCNDLRASLPVEQRSNASLAVALANTFLSRTEPDPSRAFLTRNDIQQGVKQFSWPARYQTIRVNNCLWCLDGAHNEFSIGTTAEWFQKLSTTAPSMRILVFAQKASKSDSTSVLRRLVQALDVEIHHVIFTTCGNEGTSSVPSGGFRQCWTSSASFPSTTWLEPTHAQVMARVVSLSSTADNIHILVTGSLHLVGSILNHLKSEEPSG